jgi:hypothetical protein
MELERIFNANTIQSVEVQEGNSVWRLNYKTEKNKWYCKRKAGFYANDSGRYCGTAEDLLNGSYNGYRILVKDNVAYWRPYVEFTFVNGEEHGKHFDTIEECNAYAKEIMDKYVKNQFKI